MAEVNNQIPRYETVRDLIRRWSLQKKIGLTILLVITIALLVLLIQLYRYADYRLLYGGLSGDDLEEISNWLQVRNIDYRTKNNSLYIAADKLYRTRVELAKQKLPYDMASGNDLLSAGQLAVIGAISGADYKIAVQQELSRTIAAMDHVDSARVHLGTADAQTEADSTPGASVVVRLKSKKTLSSDQLGLITHLVSTSAAGLQPSQVRIFDASGFELSAGAINPGLAGSAAESLAFQLSVEKTLEQKAQELVDALLGRGQAIIRVTADIDYSRTESTTESFDPEEPVVRHESTEQQPLTAAPPTPLADTSADENQIPYLPPVTTSANVDYEINKTVSKTTMPVGRVELLTVSVLVSEKRTVAADGTVEYHPRSEPELAEIESLVAAALSIKRDRGDTIHLVTIPAAQYHEDIATPGATSATELITYLPIFKIVLIGCGFILLYFLLVRPVITAVKREIDQDRQSVSAKEPLQESEPLPPQADPAAVMREEIIANPAAAAHIIKKWMQET